MLRTRISSVILATVITSAAFSASAVDDFRNPEVTSQTTQIAQREAVEGKRYMISAANPLATKAGADILASGGSAIDAAIATQMVLNVVEPQSSGIGGGGFLMYYDADQRKLHIYDGRETAPLASDETLFLDENGKPLPFAQAMRGGHSVGAPGLLKMLELAHRNHGHVEWVRLFRDAIQLSGKGFPMSPRLHDLLSTAAHIKAFPDSMRPFLNADGSLKAVGETVINKPLHDTFATLAIKGSQPFYSGDIARDIVAAVNSSAINPGELSLKDLSDYRVKTRDAVCAPYRSYKVCSMPPPSSGGVTILQALAILERVEGADIRDAAPISADAAHLFAEASKLAYADRNRYLADPDFADVPVDKLLAPDYLAERASLIAPDKATGNAEYGVFDAQEQKAAMLTTEEHPSTTHISVVDMNGNAVSMTTSIEQGFGSGLSANGFLLNNQLTDFSFSPTLPNSDIPHPNRVEPGKRPRSSMSPVMVFDENDDLIMVVGSPGGARIIQYVLQTLIGVLDWDMDIQQAINLPHYLNMNGPTELEAGSEAASLKEALEARGHRVIIHDVPSGLHGITLSNGTLTGGADTRREGVAIGQ